LGLRNNRKRPIPEVRNLLVAVDNKKKDIKTILSSEAIGVLRREISRCSTPPAKIKGPLTEKEKQRVRM